MQIKGIKDGILVHLDEGDWAAIQDDLVAQIEEKKNFFNGARLALDVGEHTLKASMLGALRDKLSEKNVTLWAVLSQSPVTQETARVLGMATQLSAPKPDRNMHKMDTQLDGDAGILIQRTMRSGYKVSFQGNVTIIGDVNPGAEIIATGSIIIWGRLLGVVHAGSEGNLKAVVCALDMRPTQLRIAQKIAVSTKKRGKAQPEIVQIKDDQIITETWKAKGAA